MKNAIIIFVVAVIIVLVVFYIYRTKKRGNKCIGCPNGCSKTDCGNCKNQKNDFS